MRVMLAAVAITALATQPLVAQDFHFTKDVGPGGQVEVENINGRIDVTRATGRTAEVTVTKTVKRGDGSTVKAIMEETSNGLHVCTVYLNRDPNRRTCSGDNNNDSRHGDHVEVDMHYAVRVPAGVRLVVANVNGDVSVTGADVESKIETVNGDVNFDGIGASSLETVNGKIVGTFSRAAWEGSLHISTVNGSVDLTFPADLSADVRGETVNGGIQSVFPITIEKGWGPKSFEGRIGNGGRRLNIETVNGGITLRKR
jgi:Putative adhesin